MYHLKKNCLLSFCRVFKVLLVYVDFKMLVDYNSY